MAMSFDTLIAEADSVIAAGAAREKTAAVTPSETIAKLASDLLASKPAQPAPGRGGPDVPLGAETVLKLAHARALMDTYVNLPLIAKMAELEVRARSAGSSEEEIAGFLQKHASQFRFRSVGELVG